MNFFFLETFFFFPHVFILYTTEGSIVLLIGVLGVGLCGSDEPMLDFERLLNQSYPVTL